MKRTLWLVGLFALLPAAAHGGGVLIPSSLGDDPLPDALALRSMDVDVVIDGPHAQVTLEQIWENRTDQSIEGRDPLRRLDQALGRLDLDSEALRLAGHKLPVRTKIVKRIGLVT